MSTTSSCACYVINLQRSPDRLARIGQELRTAGVAFERHAAVDGRAMDITQVPEFDVASYERLHGKKPVPNEVGCYLSHMGVMQRFLQTEHTHCLVLEDDAIIPANFAAVIEQVLASPANGDMTMLYGNRQGVSLPVMRLSGLGTLVGYWGKQTGAVAYLVNRHAAQAFLNHLLPMRLPLDHAFGQVWLLGIRIRGVHPFPVTTGAFVSDIGKTGEKFPWPQRLQTLQFRMLSELRRYGYHLFKDRIWWPAMRYWLSLN